VENPPTRQEVIRATWDKLKPAGRTDFARKLELDQGGYLKVKRWLDDDAPLQWEDAAKMLTILGWLRTEPSLIEQIEDHVRRQKAGWQPSRRERERVARLADRLQEDVGRLAAYLREGSQDVGTS